MPASKQTCGPLRASAALMLRAFAVRAFPALSLPNVGWQKSWINNGSNGSIAPTFCAMLPACDRTGARLGLRGGDVADPKSKLCIYWARIDNVAEQMEQSSHQKRHHGAGGSTSGRRATGGKPEGGLQSPGSVFLPSVHG
ncbi:hypothetical protein B0J18DRAFT_294090 [Chaetomium sp. MPI-SDFR-AT-0129]|nr:hypothetical protein B0J18DRAFT_294090 [Chaetomium sp. MPI-SDFR-AT-0129]